MKNSLLIIIILFLGSMFELSAQAPSGYYKSSYGKSGAALKTAMRDVIYNHTTLSYASLWTHFKETDRKDNGYVWDMYSDGNSWGYQFTFGDNQCGNYKQEGDCYNREHSMPKSWFNDTAPMNSDLFHLYPTDGYVNNMRGNLPFGEVGKANWTSSNGSKRGTSNYPGYSDIVFEPVDIYKGDFARTYFYMVTCYEDKLGSWNSDMLSKKAYPGFTAWAQNLLLKWSRNDEVSQKEIDRNETVYRIQGNRNPFIDYPQLAEYIWGDSITYKFDPEKIEVPNPEPDPGPEGDYIINFWGPWHEMPSGFVSNSTEYYGTYYNSLALKESGKYLIVSFEEAPGELLFDMQAYEGWQSDGECIYVFESESSDDFENHIVSFDHSFLTTTEVTNSGKIQLAESTRSIKILFQKSSKNVAIDNLKITKRSLSNLNEVESQEPIVYASFNQLYVGNVVPNSIVRIYNMRGQIMSQSIITSDAVSITLGGEQIYFVTLLSPNGQVRSYKIIN